MKKGTHHTPESIEKMRQNMKWTEERRQYMSDLMRGRKHSDESRARISEGMKQSHARRRGDGDQNTV